MFETVRYDTKSKSLNFCLSLFRSASIGENPGQIDDFGERLSRKIHAQVERQGKAD